MNGIELLDAFRQRRAESAFSELIRRYTNLVYSVAKRHLASQSLAQDAAQTVFVRLANHPPQLSSEAELTSWLHRTAVHVSIDLWRSEARRRAREEHAAAMQLNLNADPSWTEIAPALDEALNALDDADRRTLLLRFFDHKSMREVGGLFGITEAAAKMRVSRALDRLRLQLGTRGVTSTTVAVGTFLAEHAVEAAPSEIAAAIASFGYPIAQGTGTAAAGATGFLAGVSMAKLAAGFAALALIAVTAFRLVQRHQPGESTSSDSTATTAALETPDDRNSSGPGAHTAAASVDATEPDPAKLLQAVARARQRIATGSMEFQVETFFLPQQETNRMTVTAVFDGNRRRFEKLGREYAYAYDRDPVKAEEIQAKARAFGPDKEGAIRAGLLTGFEAHYVTSYDGASLMQYRETDGKPEGATVDDPSKGTSAFIFDPRCLGLSPALSAESSVESCLGGDSSRSAELVGKELVEGIAAWHLRVPDAHPLDFWLDVADPARVLKVQSGPAVAISRYQNATAGNPLPTEVIATHFRDGAPAFGTRFVQTAAQFNITVEPVTFTLAGLGMKAGTSVSDVRIHRRIGYWTGAELSEDLPRKAGSLPDDQPSLEEMLAILDNADPASPAAFEAAQWILLNTPDGPEVEKAAAVILGEHIRSPELSALCQQMERLRHRCAVELLETALKENPEPEVRAVACFTLATLRKEACKFGEDKQLTAQAVALFERVISEFSQAGSTGADLARKARTELSELRRLTIGKPAPDFEGMDLQGRRIRLSDQRGNVAIVVFWTASTDDGVEEHRRLLAPLAGRPFVWIGINCDNDLARATAAVERSEISWPVIWDGRSGPISADWNVNSWLSVFVLDRNGVIRSREARGQALVDAVASLLPPKAQ